ncbi:uncharacterized protein [Aristolochia californica]|uniref:uncharacterized protein n=1 Tax=Aristolochia californica TaxID=171875 RepID=UPI0035DFC215
MTIADLRNPCSYNIKISPLYDIRRPPGKSPRVSALRSSLSESDLAGEEILQIFLKERQLNGDIISKASDRNWKNDSEKRKRLNFLKYDALKRELFLLTTGIGAACSGYCLLTLSIQASISYALGVVFSCIYLQLLYYHVDSVSKEAFPLVFLQKKPKKIGIRSEDLNNLLEKTVRGSALALSSPRLVMPAAIYGLWGLSHNFFSGFFDFQLVPARFGLFAYKAAALVQVYRDNEDLRFIFADNEGSE